MKNLDRYTVTSLWLADFLSDPVRRIILTISKCSHLNDADKLLGELCTVIQSETRHILHTNPVAMKKISEDARTFGFSESELSRRLKINAGEHTNTPSISPTTMAFSRQSCASTCFGRIQPMNSLTSQKPMWRPCSGQRRASRPYMKGSSPIGLSAAQNNFTVPHYAPQGTPAPTVIISITERRTMNDLIDLLSLFPPDRDRIHELSVKCRQTGLSPPESDELAFLEGLEALSTLMQFEQEE